MPTQSRVLTTPFCTPLRPDCMFMTWRLKVIQAIRRMFGLHLVRPGKIEPEWSAYLTASLDDRFAVDYDVETYFSKKEARSEFLRAGEFLDRMRHYL